MVLGEEQQGGSAAGAAKGEVRAEEPGHHVYPTLQGPAGRRGS